MNKVRKSKVRDPYLSTTGVENLFILEYLPDAPGDYVKVYLFALMCAELAPHIDKADAARMLHISEDTVHDAMEYWVKNGVVQVGADKNGETVYTFTRLIESVYGRNGAKQGIVSEDGEGVAIEERAEEDFSDALKALFDKYEIITGKSIASTEMDRIRDLVVTFGVAPEVVEYAMRIASENDKTSIKYISGIVVRWAKAGCKTLDEVKAYIDERSHRHEYYRAVLRELGIKREPAPAEAEMMDKWVEEWSFTWNEILDAARSSVGIREPNLKYLNKVLENRMLETGGIKKTTQTARSATPIARNTVQSGSTGVGGSNGSAAAAAVADTPGPAVSERVFAEYMKYVRARQAKIRNEHEAEASEKIDAMQELLDKENQIRAALLTFDTSADAKASRAQNREMLKALDATKRRMLEQSGFSQDYLDLQYICPSCKDTGLLDTGEYCACANVRAKEAYEWNKRRNL